MSKFKWNIICFQGIALQKRRQSLEQRLKQFAAKQTACRLNTIWLPPQLQGRFFVVFLYVGKVCV